MAGDSSHISPLGAIGLRPGAFLNAFHLLSVCVFVCVCKCAAGGSLQGGKSSNFFSAARKQVSPLQQCLPFETLLRDPSRRPTASPMLMTLLGELQRHLRKTAKLKTNKNKTYRPWRATPLQTHWKTENSEQDVQR